MSKKIVLGVTGASGSILAWRFMEAARSNEIHLIISRNSDQVIAYEMGKSSSDFEKLSTFSYSDSDLAARVSSGSFIFDAMVVMPCSMNTLAKIAGGISDSLITRVAAVCLKERRRLILVPREMPLSEIALENMLKLTRAGAIIAPSMPSFYTLPKNIDDMVNFVVSRILDLSGIENDLIKRWKQEG
ncbi:MAG: UbiX family flavin prenyltransferase [Thermoplasmataceae archaeon]